MARYPGHTLSCSLYFSSNLLCLLRKMYFSQNGSLFHINVRLALLNNGRRKHTLILDPQKYRHGIRIRCDISITHKWIHPCSNAKVFFCLFVKIFRIPGYETYRSFLHMCSLQGMGLFYLEFYALYFGVRCYRLTSIC